MPVLEPRRGSLAARLAAGHHPVTVFLAVIACGLALMASLSVGLGLLVSDVLVHHWGIGADDEWLPRWLAAHRDPTRTEASLIGSIMAGGVVLPIIGGAIAFVCAVLRRWGLGAFVIFALGVESATYGITALLVHRQRPHVDRLESLPANASYPSGHTAAAIAVYGGIVLLLTSRFRNSAFRVFAWTLAVAIPIFVAMARMYRGMHHPLDSLGAVPIGIAALVVVVFACRAAGAAAAARR